MKEKLLAALRGGITTVLIPKENEKDLAEIPDNVKKGMKILFMNTVEEVLKFALTKPLIPIEWDEAEEMAKAAATRPKTDDASRRRGEALGGRSGVSPYDHRLPGRGSCELPTCPCLCPVDEYSV